MTFRNIFFATSDMIALLLMAAGAEYEKDNKFKHWGWNKSDCIVICGCNNPDSIKSIVKLVANKLGVTILSENQFHALQTAKCKNLYLHSFYQYSEKTNEAILNFNFDKITLYSDGIKNLIEPINISAKMNISNLLYFGWIDNSRFKDLNGINFTIVPWVALRSIYELAASFIHEDHLKKIGMSKLKADDFLLIQRYYGKGVYSFETESSEKEFIQLLADELYKNFPADSIVICPDSRCSLAFNNYCSLAFEKYYGIVNTINPSADDEGILDGMPIESLLMSLSPEQLPQTAFGYDSGTSLSLKGICLSDYGYFNLNTDLFNFFKSKEAAGNIIKHYTNRYSMAYNSLNKLPSFSDKCIVLRNNNVDLMLVPFHSIATD